MKRALLVGCSLLVLGAGQAQGSARRWVFAHYMVCFATYGESIAAYQREIREAQAAGIDGFALNVGAWSREPHYPRRVRLIYQAAQELGTGFRLFFSVDMGDVPDILEMIRTYARHPNQFTYRGRVVVSTFATETLPWREQVLDPLKREGISVFFVPYFYPRPNVTELPDEAAVREHYRKHAGTVDGMFYFGAAGLPEELAASNAAYARVMRQAGKVCMASYTPHYWGFRQPGRRYYETAGGEGTELQWRSLIAARPDWVEIVTWNDFNESSYVSPIADPGTCLDELKRPPRPCHAAYLELSRYFIDWFKSGRRPPIRRDGLFAFYRTHPKDLPPLGDEKPVTSRYGEVQDVIYLTSLLRAPAQVHVTTGGQRIVRPVPAGLYHWRAPFRPGEQHFEVWRHGRRLIAFDGPAVESRPPLLNFFPATAFGYADGK